MHEPLIVYCAEALRVPMEATARDYEREVGQKVRLHIGPSQTILTAMQLAKVGDLWADILDKKHDLAGALS